MAKTIKEITIESYPGFFANLRYEDKLRINENGLFYKKINIYNKEKSKSLEDVVWSYRSNSKEYRRLFNKLIRFFEKYEYKGQQLALDAGGFIISIKYVDRTKDGFYFNDIGVFGDDPITKALEIIRKMVPSTEEELTYLL